MKPAQASPRRLTRWSPRVSARRLLQFEPLERRALLTTGLPILNDTPGYYNADLGNVLDGPTNNPNMTKPPDISAAAGVLGNWLTAQVPPSNGHWKGPMTIPSTWAGTTDTAVVYVITVDPGSQVQLTGTFAVDNGIIVWVDGSFRFGAIEEGEAVSGEYSNKDLGVVGGGTHFIQIFREDHGGATGYDVNIQGRVLPPPRGTVQFSSDRYEVVEGQGAARITVTRSGGTAGTMSVRFKTSDITARAPDDYTAAFAVVSFGAGDSGPKELMVPITDDSLPEGDETAQLVLEDPLEEAAIGDPRFAILKIRDNDRPGTLRFQTDRFEVAEGQPRAAVVVTREGGGRGVVSAKVTTAVGSATPGADYRSTVSLVTFADGEIASKTVLVPIVDDKLLEGDETVGLSLSDATGGATLGDPRAATLVIHDNEAPKPRFLKDEFRVRENGGRARITVVLERPSPTPVTYRVRTVQLARPAGRGLATEGRDYVAVRRTLTISPNRTSAEFFVTLLDDNITEGEERFGLEVSDFSTGKVLARSRVVIIDTARPRPR